MSMKKPLALWVSVPTFALSILCMFGVTSAEVACSSSAKTCTQSEDQACTDTYTTCISAAAANADLNACQKCNDDYCGCYDKCGTTCDKSKLQPCTK
jgi:hypothetical protein